MTEHRRNLAAIAPVVAAAYMTLPEAWTKPLRVGDVSVMNILFMVCLALSFWGRDKRGRSNSGWILCGFAGLVYMAARGLMNQASEMFDVKVYLADMLTFCGLLAGMLWARRTSIEQLARTLRWVAIATVAVLIIDALSLQVGILKPAWEGPRVFVFSMFFGTWWLMAVAPFILATEGIGEGILSVKWSRVLLMAVVAALLAIAVMSGTRTVALQVIACGAMCAPLMLRNFRTAYATVILALMIGTAAYVVGPRLGDFQFFGSRLAATDIASEERYAELQVMFEQLMPDIAIGEGFGSSFVSPVMFDGKNLAVAPHVGILTVMFKGGFVCFVLITFLPMARAFFSLLLIRGRPASYGCMAGVILYGIAASLSGGWGFFHLFLLGLLFSAGLKFLDAAEAVPARLDPGLAACVLALLGGHFEPAPLTR
jgi:hypothetical protein